MQKRRQGVVNECQPDIMHVDGAARRCLVTVEMHA